MATLTVGALGSDVTDFYRHNDEPTSAERYAHGIEVRAIWQQIPSRSRIGYGRFRDAWIIAVRDGASQNDMAAGLLAYYKSEQGRGKYARRPHTFIHDEGWTEPREAWGAGSERDGTNPSGAAPAIDWSDCKPLSEYRKEC